MCVCIVRDQEKKEQGKTREKKPKSKCKDWDIEWEQDKRFFQWRKKKERKRKWSKPEKKEIRSICEKGKNEWIIIMKDQRPETEKSEKKESIRQKKTGSSLSLSLLSCTVENVDRERELEPWCDEWMNESKGTNKKKI